MWVEIESESMRRIRYVLPFYSSSYGMLGCPCVVLFHLVLDSLVLVVPGIVPSSHVVALVHHVSLRRQWFS